MRTANEFSLLHRSMIGADRLADLVETAMTADVDQTYPAYDVEKTGEDAYRIALATAGFAPSELEITVQPSLLIVSGRPSEDRERRFVHRGIRRRTFARHFELSDHVVVKSAVYADGVLRIDLVREAPEPRKPRRVEIGVPADVVEQTDQRQQPRRAA